jgi:zinc ribbon protein
MSASAQATDSCPDCGATLPAGARYCPACGSDLGAAQVPAWEAPASYRQAEPHWFGVAPPQLLLGVAVVLLVFALVLFATGHWPYGLIVLGVGALLLAAFLEAAKRRPGNHAFLRTSSQARERAQSAMETWRVRSAAAAELRRVRHALMLLESDRRDLLLDLGGAAHRGDTAAEATLRERLTELDAAEERLRGELDSALTDAGERIRKARLPVEETMMVLPSEPAPPPGEADPPQPAIVPEPYPPPDEADPPQPARVPEPGPGAPDES